MVHSHPEWTTLLVINTNNFALNQEHGARLTIRVYLPYSLICKLNTIRKQKRKYKGYNRVDQSYKNLSNSILHFILPPHYFPFWVFLDKVLEDLEKVHEANQGKYFIFLLNASGNEADDPSSLKKTPKQKQTQAIFLKKKK